MNAITVKLATFGAEPAELHRRPLHRLPRDRAPTNSCSTTDHNIVLQPALVIRGTTAEATGAAVDWQAVPLGIPHKHAWPAGLAVGQAKRKPAAVSEVPPNRYGPPDRKLQPRRVPGRTPERRVYRVLVT
jgi:hypothetical protein